MNKMAKILIRMIFDVGTVLSVNNNTITKIKNV